MELREILLENLRNKYGNLSSASRAVGIERHILQNWADKYSHPNLSHLETISDQTRINACIWIDENFMSVHYHLDYIQQQSLAYHLQINISSLMIETGRRRRDIVLEFNGGYADIMSPDSFDNYRKGKVSNIPLYRLQQLATFFNCKPQKLLEVK